MSLPGFDPIGNLPAGVYKATWREFEEQFGWNDHRRRLLAGLIEALQSLKRSGVVTVWIDGSFVTAKDAPGDFDACYEASDDMNPDLLDAELLDFRQGRTRQKQRYGGELFLAQGAASTDAGGTLVSYLSFFQTDSRTGSVKGIVQLDLTQEFP